MNLSDLTNKTILLLGKSRAFSSDEFNAQMKHHKISVVKEHDDDVVLIVDGKMMTPYEQNLSDRLYEEKKADSISIDVLERELARHIDADTLLMSLKLSRDTERLKGFIQNTMLEDELFFRLLKLYSWGGEDFFESDDNRDVTAALISRFYENIERNHNVQYATLGLMHLIKQTKNEKLIEAIATLEPLKHSFKAQNSDANYSIVTSIARHTNTPKSVLKMLVKYANTEVQTIVALREDIDKTMQEFLYESSEDIILEALSHNVSLDSSIVNKLITKSEYAKNIAKFITLNAEFFENLVKEHSVELAQNISLDVSMQNKLLILESLEVNISLASNINIDKEIIQKLLKMKIDSVNEALYSNINTPTDILKAAFDVESNHVILSGNESTPQDILKELSNSSDAKVLNNLAKNTSTPVDILYQLQLDSRFERYVKENPTFGKHIQSENIGWLV